MFICYLTYIFIIFKATFYISLRISNKQTNHLEIVPRGTFKNHKMKKLEIKTIIHFYHDGSGSIEWYYETSPLNFKTIATSEITKDNLNNLLTEGIIIPTYNTAYNSTNNKINYFHFK